MADLASRLGAVKLKSKAPANAAEGSNGAASASAAPRAELIDAIESEDITIVTGILNAAPSGSVCYAELRAACFQGNVKLLELLLQHGGKAHLHTQDPVSGRSLLHDAANNNNANVCRRLLELGVDPAVISRKDGGTALQLAQECDNREAVAALLGQSPAKPQSAGPSAPPPKASAAPKAPVAPAAAEPAAPKPSGLAAALAGAKLKKGTYQGDYPPEPAPQQPPPPAPISGDAPTASDLAFAAIWKEGLEHEAGTNGRKRDIDAAKRCYFTASEKGSGVGMLLRWQLEMRQALALTGSYSDKGAFSKAYEPPLSDEIRRMAAAGEPGAQWALATLCLARPRDPVLKAMDDRTREAEARRLLDLAAAKDCLPALLLQLEKPELRAGRPGYDFTLKSKAAALGDINSMLRLGDAYRYGEGCQALQAKAKEALGNKDADRLIYVMENPREADDDGGGDSSPAPSKGGGGQSCGSCGGSGRKKCNFCGGTGSFQKKSCTHCSGGANKCTSCRGSGKR